MWKPSRLFSRELTQPQYRLILESPLHESSLIKLITQLGHIIVPTPSLTFPMDFSNLWKHRYRFTTSGVFKGRRARSPLRCYVYKWSLFLVKNLSSTHIMCYKADHKQVLCFQRAPLQKLQYTGTLLSNDPQQQLQFEGNLLSKGPQQPLICVSTLLLNFIFRRNCSV